MANAIINSTGNIYYSKMRTTASSSSLVVTDLLTATSATSTAEKTYTASGISNTCTAHTTVKSESSPEVGVNATRFFIVTNNVMCGYQLTTTAAMTLASHHAITFYISAKTAIPASSLQLLVCTDTAGITPVETINLPAIAAGGWDTTNNVPDTDTVWYRVVLRLNNPSSDTSLDSIAFKTTTAFTGDYFAIYQVRALAEMPGRTNFSISESLDEIDVSDYQSRYSREFADSFSAWTLSIDGHKEGAPPFDLRSVYTIGIAETDTVGQAFVGDAFYTGFTPAGTFSDKVSYPYSCRGVGFLYKPTA